MALVIRWPEGPVGVIRRPRHRRRYDTGSGLGWLTGLYPSRQDPSVKRLPEADV